MKTDLHLVRVQLTFQRGAVFCHDVTIWLVEKLPASCGKKKNNSATKYWKHWVKRNVPAVLKTAFYAFEKKTPKKTWKLARTCVSWFEFNGQLNGAGLSMTTSKENYVPQFDWLRNFRLLSSRASVTVKTKSMRGYLHSTGDKCFCPDWLRRLNWTLLPLARGFWVDVAPSAAEFPSIVFCPKRIVRPWWRQATTPRKRTDTTREPRATEAPASWRARSRTTQRSSSRDCRHGSPSSRLAPSCPPSSWSVSSLSPSASACSSRPTTSRSWRYLRSVCSARVDRIWFRWRCDRIRGNNVCFMWKPPTWR